MRHKNPLSGKAFFDKDGNLSIEKGIKFGGQIKPNVNAREWFYLLSEACNEKEVPDSAKGLISKWVGSRSTQWRVKNSLIKKGLL